MVLIESIPCAPTLSMSRRVCGPATSQAGPLAAFCSMGAQAPTPTTTTVAATVAYSIQGKVMSKVLHIKTCTIGAYESMGQGTSAAHLHIAKPQPYDKAALNWVA